MPTIRALLLEMADFQDFHLQTRMDPCFIVKLQIKAIIIIFGMKKNSFTWAATFYSQTRVRFIFSAAKQWCETAMLKEN